MASARPSSFVFALCVMLVTFVAAYADETGDFAVESRSASLQAPAGSGVGTQLQGAIDVLAGDGDGTATLKIIHRLKNVFEGKYFRAQYRFSAPLDRDKSDQADIGTLSDLAGGTTLGIEFSYINAPEDDEVQQLRRNAVEEQCDAAINQLLPGYNRQLISRAGHGSICTIVGLRDKEALKKAVEQLKKDRVACEKTPTTQYCKQYCKMLSNAGKDPDYAIPVDEWLEAFGKTIDDSIDAAVGPIGMFTIGLRINEKKFDYVLPNALDTTLSERENGWSASLAYTRINVDTIWAVGYTHEESYTAGTKSEICVPLGTEDALSCSDLTIGAPSREKKELVYGEYRRFVLDDDVAISPRVEFDAEESEWAIRVPVYLTGNDKGRLTAGIVFGWDEKNDAGAGIFVAKPLGFFD